VVNRRTWIAIGLGALLGGGLIVSRFTDPRARESRRVQDQLQTLARTVSFSEQDAPLRKLSYAERVVRFFGDATALDLSLGTFHKQGALARGDLREVLAGIRAGNRGLDVQFLDIVPELDESMRSATAHLTAKIYDRQAVLDSGASESMAEIRRRLVGGWRTTLRTMEQ
jgi:hypothetical protein